MNYIGKCYYDGNSFYSLKEVGDHSGKNIYEVVRLINHKVLFWADHYKRLLGSLQKAGFNADLKPADELKRIIEELSINNGMANVNVRLDMYPEKSKQIFLGTIPSFYPSNDAYENGVRTVSIKATRNNPNIKLVDKQLKSRVTQILSDNSLYEVLLVDKDNRVREGSKSNLFFICNNKVFTAPDSEVLQGITRQKVLDICREHEIEVVFESLNYSNLNNCQSAFVTGTSPKVLPLCSIDNLIYQTKHPILQIIIKAYNNLISNML